MKWATTLTNNSYILLPINHKMGNSYPLYVHLVQS